MRVARHSKSCPENQIWYSSTNKRVVEPSNPDAFDAKIVSNSYTSEGGVIIFEGEISTVGDNAFCGCSLLQTITLPKSITQISSTAFRECSALDKFYGEHSSADGDALIINQRLIAFAHRVKNCQYIIPKGVVAIGKYAFDSHTALQSIIIDADVESIHEAAFYHCTNLTSVIIGNKVRNICKEAFMGCSALTDIIIGNSVTTISDSAFYYCNNLKHITFGNKVNTIPDSAFRGCDNLTQITLPESITHIGNAAFMRCSSLLSVIIKAPIPPQITDTTFDSATDYMIYIPKQSISLYTNSNCWVKLLNKIATSTPSHNKMDAQPNKTQTPLLKKL